MASQTKLNESDEGKRVINNSGDKVGRLVDVESGVGYVDPDPGVTDTVKSKLGWMDKTETDSFRLDATRVSNITENKIRLDF
jgi:sporulation protein YlmC with PRC-barrel domain